MNYDSYKHLNEPTEVGMSIPDIAKQLSTINYGQQRMLAEIVRVREESENYIKYEQFRKRTEKLKALLESGWY